MSISFRLTSGMTKALLQDDMEAFKPQTAATALQNDRFYFCGLYTAPPEGWHSGVRLTVRIRSALRRAVTVYRAEQVPVRLPFYPDRTDDDYLLQGPGLVPDLLRPAKTVMVQGGLLQQLVFEVRVPADMAPGAYPITVSLLDGEGKTVAKQTLTLTVLAAVLPKQTLKVAEWFHCDCLATYYRTKVFSKRHWRLIENYMKTAVDTGINCILTPVFTPPLDTAVGGERPTVQLVDVTRENGAYTFGFEKLKQFCELCRRVGVEELEIAHFFTQWGAEHAPKVMATVDGTYRRLFGWDTDSTGPEYVAFLRTFIPQLKQKLDEYGYAGHYYFHISDEPGEKHRARYAAAREAVWDLICDHPVRDALADYSFYTTGMVQHPIVATNYAEEFIKNDVPDLWLYYCCGQNQKVSNRFHAMPGYRTRVLGAQLYKSKATGFLQWGYNFWYSRYSLEEIEPYVITDGDYFTPAGDPFVVYPGRDEKPLLSLRHVQFVQALYDERALRLAEAKCGRDAVVAEIDREYPLQLNDYPKSEDYLLHLRDRINRMAAE